jgi:hypothetical protein
VFTYFHMVAEHRAVRASIGALLWLALRTRPDIFYSVINAACKSNTEGAVTKINKIVRYLKKTGPVPLRFKYFPDCSAINVIVILDASLGREEGERSQLGFSVFLANGAPGADPHALDKADELIMHMIYYVSRVIRRVCNNSLGSETYASLPATDSLLVILSQVKSIIGSLSSEVEIRSHVISDCMSLFNVALSRNPKVEDMKLLPSIRKVGSLWDEVDRLWHIPGNRNPMDPLTKKMSRCSKTLIALRKILETGVWKPEELLLVQKKR